MKKKNIITVLAIILCMSLFAGCSKKEESEKKKELAEELKTIGSEVEGENVYKVALENKTGKDIISVSVKDSSMTEYPANMLAPDDAFVKDEKRNLFYDSTSAIEAAKAAQTDAAKAILDPQYDIQLVFDDQSTLVLNAFPFTDIKEGEICLEDAVAFVKYKSVATKEEISTKDAELNIRAQAEAAAEEAKRQEEEARKQAEEEARKQAEEEARKQAEEEARRQAEEARRQAEEARRQAEEEARRQAEEAKRQQQQSSGGNTQEGCVGDGLIY